MKCWAENRLITDVTNCVDCELECDYSQLYFADRETAKQFGLIIAEKQKKRQAVLSGNIIAADPEYTAYVRPDGKLDILGPGGELFHEIYKWNNIRRVVSCSDFIAALTEDGTLKTDGNIRETIKNVSSFSASAKHAVAVTEERIRTIGSSRTSALNVSSWSNIVDVITTQQWTVALKMDGTVVATDERMNNMIKKFRGIRMIASGLNFVCLLLSDGTIAFESTDTKSRLRGIVSDWKDVKAIAASKYHCFALCGTQDVLTTLPENLSFDVPEFSADSLYAYENGVVLMNRSQCDFRIPQYCEGLFYNQ